MIGLSVLLIDDDESQLEFLTSLLSVVEHPPLTVFSASSAAEGFRIIEKNMVNLVITDYLMPGMSGEEVLRKVREDNPGIDVVMLTAVDNVDKAVETMKLGAYDYIVKPVRRERLTALFIRVLEKQTLVSENRRLRLEVLGKTRFDFIISRSGAMEQVLNTVARVASSRSPVLLQGESGTGKELVARAIHFAGPRKDKPFIAVNMAALPEGLIESELFGLRKGAFTDAQRDREGRFEQAHGGTLFIDEVGEIPLSVQVKLLRALQSGEIERLGAESSTKVDVRIVSATNRNLDAMVKSGGFRLDLFYRLNVVTITIPPLRNRRVDIPWLADHFIEKYAAENGKQVKGISREAMDRLMKHSFPGNIRELENIIERAVVLSRGEQLISDDLPPLGTLLGTEEAAGEGSDYDTVMDRFESRLLKEALDQASWNQSAAARKLGISERRLRSRMERLDLRRPQGNHLRSPSP